MRLKVMGGDSSLTNIWNMHRNIWGECQKCIIGQFAHNHVFARGIVPCDILFVGEAPGKTEDMLGSPFVGKSGKMLDDWFARAKACIIPDPMAGCPLTRAMTEPTYAITNIVACRPCDRPGGQQRPTSTQEIANCKPRFEQFVRDIAKPKVIVTVGRFADANRTWADIPTIGIEHPGFVMRQYDNEKRASLERDLIQRMSIFFRKELYNG